MEIDLAALAEICELNVELRYIIYTFSVFVFAWTNVVFLKVKYATNFILLLT